MAGQLTIAPFRAVTIDPERDGNINWAQDPFGDPTWAVDFQGGQWVEALVEAYLAGGPNAAAYRDRAEALLLGWLSLWGSITGSGLDGFPAGIIAE